MATFTPGLAMRYVERAGKLVLQQVWIEQVYSGSGTWHGGEHRWRDVPIMSEMVVDDGKYWVKSC